MWAAMGPKVVGESWHLSHESIHFARTAREAQRNSGLPGCFFFRAIAEAQDFRGGQDVAR
jgi:hypothetical protein